MFGNVMERKYLQQELDFKQDLQARASVTLLGAEVLFEVEEEFMNSL